MKHFLARGVVYGEIQAVKYWELDANTLQHSVHDFFRVVVAVLFPADAAARQLAVRVSASGLRNYDSNLKQALTNRQVIWLHAVSVGEVNLCTQLIRALEPRVPNLKIVVSTTTTTGMAELRRRLPTHISKIYYPIDRRQICQPRAGHHQSRGHRAGRGGNLAEFSLARARSAGFRFFWPTPGCPTVRYRGYRRFGFLFRPLFASFAGVGCQNEADAARLREVGCRPEAIRVVGNLKFDAAKLDERRRLDVPALLRQIGVPADAPILVGGSTHDGEEVILAEIAQRLRTLFPEAFSGAGAPAFRAHAGRWAGNCASAASNLFIATKSLRSTQFSEGRSGMPAGQHDRRAAVFLRTCDSGVRRQKPHGGRRAESD